MTPTKASLVPSGDQTGPYANLTGRRLTALPLGRIREMPTPSSKAIVEPSGDQTGLLTLEPFAFADDAIGAGALGASPSTLTMNSCTPTLSCLRRRSAFRPATN